MGLARGSSKATNKGTRRSQLSRIDHHSGCYRHLHRYNRRRHCCHCCPIHSQSCIYKRHLDHSMGLARGSSQATSKGTRRSQLSRTDHHSGCCRHLHKYILWSHCCHQNLHCCPVHSQSCICKQHLHHSKGLAEVSWKATSRGTRRNQLSHRDRRLDCCKDLHRYILWSHYYPRYCCRHDLLVQVD